MFGFGFGSKTKKYKDIEVSEFKELMKQKDTVILDVRTQAETSDGKIPNSQLINIMSLDFKGKVSKLDKDKTYLVYCRSGARSGKACKTMAKLGFDKLYNLSGGIIAWKNEN